MFSALRFIVIDSSEVVKEEMRSGSFSHHIKLYSFMFMHNISTTVVYVNGKCPANSVIRRITCHYL